jgi:hypothetical protein
MRKALHATRTGRGFLIEGSQAAVAQRQILPTHFGGTAGIDDHHFTCIANDHGIGAFGRNATMIPATVYAGSSRNRG